MSPPASPAPLSAVPAGRSRGDGAPTSGTHHLSLILLLTASLLLFAAPFLWRPTVSASTRQFRALLDTNQDGQLSPNEWQIATGEAESWKVVDLDGSGQIEDAELQQVLHHRSPLRPSPAPLQRVQ
jgi:hypothetical protein